MNLASLTSAVTLFAQDAAQSRYSGLYTGALNQAQQQFCLDSKSLWADWPAVYPTAGQQTFSLPTDFMFEKKVTYNGIKLNPVSRAELEREMTDTRWDTVTGRPTRYIIDPEKARRSLTLYPIPDANSAGFDLVMTYYPMPADMTQPTDIPLNGNPIMAQFHLGLAAWAAWYLLQGEASDPNIPAKKKALLDIYNDCVSQAAETFQNTASEPIRLRGVRNYV